MKYLMYYIFFIIIIIAFAYFNSLHDAEGFTPTIREMYRPYTRHARIRGTDFYNRQIKRLANLLKKMGIV